MRLGYRLPLLVSVLLVSSSMAGTWLAYREIRSATLSAAEDRVRAVSDQLVTVVENALAQRRALLERSVADATVRAAAVTGSDVDTAALAAALVPLRGADTSGVVVLLRADGSTLRLGERTDAPTPPAEALLGFAGPEAPRYTRIMTVRGRSFFWVALPFTAADGAPALLAQLRPIRGDATMLEELVGDDAAIYLTNADGGDWIPFGAAPAPAPAATTMVGDRIEYERDGRGYGALARALPTTPWQLIVELPDDVALARAHLFLRRLVAVGALLSLFGIGVAVLITRRLLRPIGELGAAARAIASGAYDRRVAVRGDDEIAELADSFNAMAAQVELAVGEARHGQLQANEANRAKSAFLATMSHEIRTPINAIVGYAELLDLGLAGQPSQEQRSFLERIMLSGRHLTRLVDEILDIARIEAGELRVVPTLCRAAERLHAAATFVTPQARLRRVTLAVAAEDVSFLGDPQRVEQILINMLSNAVKFTDEGGSVRTMCRAADAPPALGGGTMCCFEVADDGCGVPEDMLEAIFEPFVQADSGYTRSRGGAGLGLSISRELARLMGGAITVRSRVGVGSTFLLWLPLAPVHAHRMAPARA